MMQQLPLGFHEQVSLRLRSLYRTYGYSRYKMNKFEEYDLYARNKDFLISDSVITFMDTNGKLMALKPDVTLSIIKNCKDQAKSLQKLYYTENVYRTDSGTHTFKELMQVGLECLGNIDDYCICEVLMLAARSLLTISEDCILDISHLGLLSQLIDAIGIPGDKKDALLKCIGEKNLHELSRICQSCEIPEEKIELLKQVLSASGMPERVLPQIRALLSGVMDTGYVDQLIRIMDALADNGIKNILRFDFSVVDDVHYYNGIVFKGFIHGLPSSVLSGGQYDKLMRKMRRQSGAIGFAVYMDALERLDPRVREYDVDVVLLYEAGCDLPLIRNTVADFTDQGYRVMVQRQIPENIRFRKLVNLNVSGVVTFEDHA